MKFQIKNKKHDIVFDARDIDDLMKQLEYDEIPCKVINTVTNARMKISRVRLPWGGFKLVYAADY